MNITIDCRPVKFSPAFLQQTTRNIEHQLGIFTTVIDSLGIEIMQSAGGRHYTCSITVKTSNGKKHYLEDQGTSIRQLLDAMVRKMRKLMYRSFSVMRTKHRRRRFDQARAG